MFGFKTVAVFYFVILYTHCSICVGYFGKRSCLSKRENGLRFGISFGLMYLIGILEVVDNPISPELWSYSDFLISQSIMGIGDALPAFCLCLVIASVLMNGKMLQIKK